MLAGLGAGQMAGLRQTAERLWMHLQEVSGFLKV